MGDARYARCKRCGRTREEVGILSWQRLCADCGVFNLADNIEQMHARSGPNFDRWRRNMAACVGGLLLDDAHGSSHTRDHDSP